MPYKKVKAKVIFSASFLWDRDIILFLFYFLRFFNEAHDDDDGRVFFLYYKFQ